MQDNYKSIGQHSDYNEYYYATEEPISSKRWKILYDEYTKKDRELNEVTDQYSRDQLLDQIDNEDFRGLNDAGDYGYRE